MDGQDSLFFLIVIYCIVLLQAADDAIADELLSLYSQQAFYHSGEAILTSPVVGPNHCRNVWFRYLMYSCNEYYLGYIMIRR